MKTENHSGESSISHVNAVGEINSLNSDTGVFKMYELGETGRRWKTEVGTNTALMCF